MITPGSLSRRAMKHAAASLCTCRGKAKSSFGKKGKPDSPKLSHKQNAHWGLDEQEQWTRQEPANLAHHQAASHRTSVNQQDKAGPQQQQDWYSAALQQSAQLDEITKQAAPEHAEALSPEENRRQKHMRRRAAAGHAAERDQNWFSITLQQSAQLDHSSSQAVV